MLIVLCVLLLAIVGCQAKTPAEEAVTSDQAVTYENYQKMTESLPSQLKIDGFKFKSGSLGDNVTIVDPALTFNKRSYLTIDGKNELSHPKTTQETLLFENEEQTVTVLVKISYTDTVMSNDLIHYSTDTGYGNTNQDLIQKSDTAVLSYRNLIVIVQQIAKDKAAGTTTEQFIKQIINNLQREG